MPATVEEGNAAVAQNTLITLSTPATGTEVLVLMLVGLGLVEFGTVQFNSQSGRLPLEFASATGNTTCVAQVYHLQVDDEFVNVGILTASTQTFLCWAVIDESNLIPTDWDLFSHTEAAGSDPQTDAYTALDTGVQLGAAVIVGVGAPSILEPYDWTLIATATDSAASVCWAYGEILAAGVQIPEFFTGEIPTGLTGEVYWFGVYDIGLRIRDAGTWSNGGGISQTRPGPAEPPARQFPPDRPLPNLPPDPTEIFLPTPPWIPGDGPYRTT